MLFSSPNSKNFREKKQLIEPGKDDSSKKALSVFMIITRQFLNRNQIKHNIL